MSKILVVEDDPSTRALIRSSLAVEGHDVREASDGEAALKSIRASAFDLILLDLRIPNVDGYRVLESIREWPSRKYTPVVVVSGIDDSPGLFREARAGASDHLQKPFGFGELIATVDSALSASARQRLERREMLSRAADVYESTIDLTEKARR